MTSPQQAPIRPFLVSLQGDISTRALIQTALDNSKIILNWFSPMNTTVIVISRTDATAIADVIHTALPYNMFIVAEIDPLKANGFMSKAAWEFLNRPRSSGRWEPE